MTGRSESDRLVAAARMAMATAEIDATLERRRHEPWWRWTLVIVGAGLLASLAWGWLA